MQENKITLEHIHEVESCIRKGIVKGLYQQHIISQGQLDAFFKIQHDR